MSRTWRVAWFVAWLSFMASCAALILGGGSIMLSAVLITVLFALTAAPLEHRRRRLTATPAPEPRPDADVAQYLNDDDREWLAGHDWRDPALDRIRITDNGDKQSRNIGWCDGKPVRRARRVESKVVDDGWVTVTYADGSTEEYPETVGHATVNYRPENANPAASPLAGYVLVVCPAGQYGSGATGCTWSMGTPEPIASVTIAEHLDDHPRTCGAARMVNLTGHAATAVAYHRQDSPLRR